MARLDPSAAAVFSKTNTFWAFFSQVLDADGTGLSMPDTLENLAVWPQTSGQKPGCSFPQARVCACFCLHTGALLSHRVGSHKNNELPLLRQQQDQFQPGDIFLPFRTAMTFPKINQRKHNQVHTQEQ